MKKIVLMTAGLVALIFVFRFMVSSLLTVAAPHAYDTIIESSRRPGHSALIVNQLLEMESVRIELNLSTDQRKQVDELMTEFSDELEEVYRQIEEEDSDRTLNLPYRNERIEDLLVLTKRRAIGLLNEKQATRIEQLELQFRDRDFVFLEHVSRRLSLSEQQLEKFKDLAVDSSHTTSNILRRWVAIPIEERPAVNEEMKIAQAELNERFLSIFTERQLKIRNELLGQRFEFQ